MCAGVFDSVAPNYDLMNDLMSLGLHRGWKAYTVLGGQSAARATGCWTSPAAPATWRWRSPARSGPTGQVVHTDINEAMLRTGRDRLLDAGVVLPTVVCDAEKLPFANDSFDLVSVAFGLRNMTHKDVALAEMNRVLKPRRQAAGAGVLEGGASRWRRPTTGIRSRSCRNWANWWPATAASYRYLAESIRMHPDQQELKAMMQKAGFGHVDFHNMTGGVVALHVGIKC